jgi:hypothetical protein
VVQNRWRQDEPSNPATFLSNSLSSKKSQWGKRVMTTDTRYPPQANPCAQCGKPIPAPEWIESGPHHTAYLWHCWECDYRFEAVAYFEPPDSEPLAA